MTYIDLINRFWTSCEELGFRTTEIALYFYLLNTNNRRSWKQTFKIDNKIVEAAIGVSYGTLKTARNRLKQAGFIDFKTKNGSAVVLYTLTKFDEVINEVVVEVTNEVDVEVASSNACAYIDKDLDKDNNSPPTHIRVGEQFPAEVFFDKTLDDCYAELKSNQSWAETVTMNTRSSGNTNFTLETFYEYLKQFFMEQQNKGETSKSPKDAMSHFASWLKIELKNKKNEQRTNKNGACNSVTPQSTSEGCERQPDWLDKQPAALKEFINSIPIGR